MKIYRGIKLAESVKLYNRYGNFNPQVKCGLDSLADMLELNGHILLSVYVRNHDEVVIDFQCGHKPHKISPANYKSGKICPKCRGVCPEQAKEELILLIERNGHKLLSEYSGNNNKALIDFGCHNAHWIKPNHYKQGVGCPICNESKGEKRVREWLENNNFTYESQMKYDGLLGLGGGLLSYDFYLPKQNILIEYQGHFHDGSSGEYSQVNLEYHIEHDKRKREYAEINNIELLEIWHYDFDNVDSILEGYFKTK
jgi:hypothetical protein